MSNSFTDSSSLDGYFKLAIERRGVLVPALTALTEEMPKGRGRYEMRQLIDAIQSADDASDLQGNRVASTLR